MRTLNSKGQIFSTDFILASIVFLFILTMTIIYSTDVSNHTYLLEKERSRQLSSLAVANALLYSGGNPANWETFPDLNNVSGIGIVSNRNEIQEEKLQQLVDLNAGNYSKAKELLGASAYGLRVSVLRLQDKQSLAEFGLEPGSEESTTAINRIAFYDGQEVILRVKVFE